MLTGGRVAYLRVGVSTSIQSASWAAEVHASGRCKAADHAPDIFGYTSARVAWMQTALPVESGRQFAVAIPRRQRSLKRREPLLESNSLMFLMFLVGL